MKLMQKINGTYNNMIQKKGNKKFIENCVIIVIVIIILIIVGSSFLSSNNNNKNRDETDYEYVQDEVKTTSQVSMVHELEVYNQYIEKKLKNILEQIEGSGTVEVMITYIAGKERIHLFDNEGSESKTNETDSSGGNREVNQDTWRNQIVYEQSGKGEAIVVKEYEPEVKGVIVVSDGAGRASIKQELTEAVCVLLNVSQHKVQVFKRDSKEK